MHANSLLGMVLAIALFATACASAPTESGSEGASTAYPSSPPASEDTGPLKILVFAGDDDAQYDEVFLAQYPDADIEYSFGDSNEDFFAKVQTGSVDADIVYGACTNFVPNWVNAGLVAPLDTARMSSWASLNTDVEAGGQVDGTQYMGVSYYGYDSIVAATDGAVPTSWADLWDPQFADQFSMIDYAENGVQMASVVLGLPYPDLTDEQLDQVKAKLLELSPTVRSYWSTVSDPIQQISNGEVNMFYGWTSQFATAQQDGLDVQYVNPSEGRLSWTCGGLIMADTEHYDLALAWLDSRLSPEVGAKIVDLQFLGPANNESLALADQGIVTDLAYDDPSVFASSHPAVALTDEQRQKFNQLWSEVIGS